MNITVGDLVLSFLAVVWLVWTFFSVPFWIRYYKKVLGINLMLLFYRECVLSHAGFAKLKANEVDYPS